jgi:hypothetical protein
MGVCLQILLDSHDTLMAAVCNGSITMKKKLLREAKAASYGAPVYLALAEYSRLLSDLDC